jgi:hypothetical protein
MTGNNGRLQLEDIHEDRKVCREITWMVARKRANRIAMPPLRQREGVYGLRQMIEDALEGAPRVGIAMQKQHRDARGIALLDIGELDPVRKFNALDSGCRV